MIEYFDERFEKFGIFSTGLKGGNVLKWIGLYEGDCKRGNHICIDNMAAEGKYSVVVFLRKLYQENTVEKPKDTERRENQIFMWKSRSEWSIMGKAMKEKRFLRINGG